METLLGIDSLEIESLEFAGTWLEGVSLAVLARLLVGSRRYEVRGGAMVFAFSDAAPRVAVVLQGTARAFLTAADGRQLTVRYARRGALIGRRSDLIGAHAPLAVQAVTDCTILEFDRDLFLMTAAAEISVATGVIVELSARMEDLYATAGDSAFGSVRQRLVRHLLALAEQDLADENHLVSVSQQQLADATGSSREAVARVLADLRAAGLIRTGPREITLLNIDALVPLLSDWHRESPY